VGWQWVAGLAQHCQLTVLTEAEFRAEILAELERGRFAYRPKFHFLDIGAEARRRCAHQGDWRFYLDYRRWQKRAFALAKRLVIEDGIDICHQLNMIGFREPGYLWKLGLPLVWGPVGGYELMPWRFLPALGAGWGAYHALRNVLNAVQLRISPRVRACCRRAGVLLAATPSNQRALGRVRGGAALLMAEVGAEPRPVRRPRRAGGALKLVWCGRSLRSKMLPIALDALARASRHGEFELHVVGSGSLAPAWRSHAVKAGVDRWCVWHGLVERARALEIMSASDAMISTSLLEGTSSVVLEALGLGLPVLCHDRCGMAVAVTEECGIRIPAHNYRSSVEGFAAAMVRLAADRDHLGRLSEGASRRAAQLSWAGRTEAMLEIYESLGRPATRHWAAAPDRYGAEPRLAESR
jgi:glycosyltransferase involved in cell wall biosynthesis